MAAIEEMIERGQWPQGWTGTEARADEKFTELNKRGEEQLQLHLTDGMGIDRKRLTVFARECIVNSGGAL